MKKFTIIFLSAALLLTSFISSEAKARGNALAITGVVLGGTALGVVGYNAYRNSRYYRDNRRYNHGYNNNVGYYPTSYNRRPCQRNNYRNSYYSNSRYQNADDYYGY
jgi:hypothetical protein